MRTITTIILLVLVSMFTNNTTAQTTPTAQKQGAKFYDLAKGQTMLNITLENIDTSNFTVEAVKTKGSRLYIEYTFVYEGAVNIDRLNAVATTAYNSSRMTFKYENEKLVINKNTPNILFVKTNGETKEITEKIQIKIYIPETINFVGM